MRRIAAVWVVLSLSVANAAEPKDPKTLDVPAEKTAAAKALIAKLDDDDVDVRDKASADLKKMGREALPALLAAAKGKPSNEVQNRLPEVLAVARAADFEARYPLFLADTDGKFEHDFLGWTELKAAVKDTKDSRLLFRDILEEADCRDMLLLAVEQSADARKKFEERWEDKEIKWGRARPLNKGEPLPGEPIHWLAAALLADLLYDRDYWSASRIHMVALYARCTDEGKQVKAGTGRHGQAVADLARHWVDRQEGQWGRKCAGYVIKSLNLGEGTSRQLIERNFALLVEKGHDTGEPLRALAATKDLQYIASLRLLFERERTYLRKVEDKAYPEIQVRDAALSMCVALSGQDPTEYGFTAHQPATAKDARRYSPDNYYFDGADAKAVDEKRTAAFKKWAEWEKANPDKLKARPAEKK